MGRRDALIIFMLLTCLGLVSMATPLLANDAGCTISTQEAWTTVFGGDEYRSHMLISCPEARAVRASWVLSAAGHAIARGESPLTLAANVPATVEVRATMPPVKEGAVVAAELKVTVTEDGKDAPLATLQHPLWVYPKDPFALRTKWLAAQHITLFDPEKHTAKRFDDAKIPYTMLANIDAMGELTEGTLIVGEGVSFDEYPGLMDNLLKAVAAGRPVLCLAPKSGSFPLPGADDTEGPIPDRLLLGRSSMITMLDKRLDARIWAGGVRVTASSLRIRAEGGAVKAELMTNNDGWSWLEMRFPRAGGRLVLCGFGIIDHWAAGPTPRFLLANILEYLGGENTSTIATP
ncbi:MAG: hypothetical protein ACYDBB_17230 [Armatimonadota bacterium]